MNKLDGYVEKVNSDIESARSEMVLVQASLSGEFAVLAECAKESGDIIDRVSGTVGLLHNHLLGVGGEIGEVGNESQGLLLKLANRRSIQYKLNEILQNTVCSPRDIEIIRQGVINEPFLQAMRSTFDKYQYCQERLTQQSEAQQVEAGKTQMSQLVSGALKDLEKVLESGLIIARNYFMATIDSLADGRANVQLVQVNSLQRYAGLVELLAAHRPDYSSEIKTLYISRITLVYQLYFKAYLSALLSVNIALKTPPLVVASRTGWGDDIYLLTNITHESAVYGDRLAASFALNERVHILKRMNETVTIPYIARVTQTRLYPEEIFRSYLHALIDNACNEYLFYQGFIDDPITRATAQTSPSDRVMDTVDSLFSDAATCITTSVSSITGTDGGLSVMADIAGLLLMLQVLACVRDELASRKISILGKHMATLDQQLWLRFNHEIDALAQQLHTPLGLVNVGKEIRARSKYSGNTPQPCWVLKLSLRFANLYKSIEEVCAAWPHSSLVRAKERLLSHYLGNIASIIGVDPPLFVRLCLSAGNEQSRVHLAQELENGANNSSALFVFFNFHTIAQIVTMSPSISLIRDVAMNTFANLELQKVLKEILIFNTVYGPTQSIKNESSSSSNNTDQMSSSMQVDVYRTRAIVQEFSKSWNGWLDVLHTRVLSVFTEYSMGQRVLNEVLSRFVIQYRTFLEILSHDPFRQHHFVAEAASVYAVYEEITRRNEVYGEAK